MQITNTRKGKLRHLYKHRAFISTSTGKDWVRLYHEFGPVSVSNEVTQLTVQKCFAFLGGHKKMGSVPRVFSLLYTDRS